MLDWTSETYDTPTHTPAGMVITGQSGLVSGTHVASNMGWRAVEALSLGDLVLTFDHGMQPITGIQREMLRFDPALAGQGGLPVFVPHGALYNRCDIWLMPEQGILVESDAAQDVLGDPFAVVPAHTLTGFRGIRRACPPLELEIITLSFARDEVVYADGGMLTHCPRVRSILSEPGEDASLYDVLPDHDARFLVECLVLQAETQAFVFQPDEVACVA